MASHPEYAVGEVIANKYVVEESLGEGPNGVTYLANAGLGSPKLCVKIFGSEISSRLLSAPDFFLKAGVATEIEHDNLAGCLEVQEEMGRVFAARAHVEGHDFEEWIRRNRREGNSFTRGLELLWQACQGLSALHERTRHLNIHPGNVLVSPLVVKLADWDPRSLGSMEMTPEPLLFRPQYAGYRAPEMAARGSFLSYPSTDLYAVAGLLYRLVLGEHPESDRNRLQAGIRSLEKDLGGFLAKALHPRPEERFQDATAFSHALWELQGSMQRLQDRQPRNAGRSVEKTAPTLAMDAGEGTLFGSAPAPAAPRTGKDPQPKEDSFFDSFPTADQAQPSPPPARKQPQPAAQETIFGSSLESPTSGGTLFGDPPPEHDASSSRIPNPASGLGGLEEPGTLFGAVPTPPPRSRPALTPDTRPAVMSLSSLEKDPLEAEQENAGGFTQFGFKGAGDNKTLYLEGKAAGQRKLRIALAAVGALVLVLALGGLFVYLRTTAAPEIPETAGDPAPAFPLENTAEPVPSATATPEPGTATATPTANGSPAGDAPPFPEAQSEETARPKPASAKATKGTPERLAQLMKMVESRQWPDSPVERLQAADELNDFGKVAEANVVYGRVLLAADITDKQRISGLGGLAVTFYSMGMKQQSQDAIDQILAINPQNGFALKFREKLK